MCPVLRLARSFSAVIVGVVMLTIFIRLQQFLQSKVKAQHPAMGCYCNISSISEIESIQIVPAKCYNGFFFSSP